MELCRTKSASVVRIIKINNLDFEIIFRGFSFSLNELIAMPDIHSIIIISQQSFQNVIRYGSKGVRGDMSNIKVRSANASVK